MALKLIIGPPASGKSGLLYDSLADSLGDGQPTLVVPTAPDVREASAELSARNTYGVAVRTLGDALGQLWLLHGDGRRMVTAATRAALLQPIAEESRAGILEESGKTRGFALLLADVARRVMRPHPASGDPTAVEMTRLVDLYQSALERAGFVEPVHAMELLAQMAVDPGGAWGVARFTDFDPAQESLLLSLAESRDVTVTLTWTEGGATAGMTPMVSRLRTRATSCLSTEEGSSTNPALSAFSRALFEVAEPLNDAGAVVFCEAGGVEAECALVARVVRRELDRGVSPGGIAVSFRDVSRRIGLLEAALRAESVQYDSDVRIPFARSPFGAAILALLDACAGRGESPERLLAFLMSPFSGMNADSVARLDRAWRARRLSPRAYVEASIESAKADSYSAARLLRLGQRLAGATVDAPSASLWQEMAGHALAHGALARGGGPPIAPGVDTAAHRALLSAVSESAAIGAGIPESDLSVALRSVEVSMAPSEHADRVLVTEAHRLRGQRFDSVVLGGLNADEFSPEPRESLAAAMAMRLGRAPGSDERLMERVVFHSAITRARSRLILVRQASDERGEPLRPSVFWEEALDVYRSADAALQGQMPSDLVIEKLSLIETAEVAPAYLPERRKARRAAARTAPSVPARGRLADDEVLSKLADRQHFSVSEIERYLQCPYRWFVESEVRPREIDRVFDARAKGSLAHEMLAAFYTRWASEGHPRVTQGELGQALEVFELVAEGCVKQNASGVDAGLAQALGVAASRAWARSIVVEDAHFLPGFAPLKHELSFGVGDVDPVVLEGLSLRGFVDRIDEGPTGLVVIDYKSSSQVKGWRSFDTARLIQVPVYAAVVSALMGRPVVGAVYRSLSTLSTRGVWLRDSVDLPRHGCSVDALDADALSAVVSDAIARMSAAADRIRAGDIAPSPATGACRMCSVAVRCEGARR